MGASEMDKMPFLVRCVGADEEPATLAPASNKAVCGADTACVARFADDEFDVCIVMVVDCMVGVSVGALLTF